MRLALGDRKKTKNSYNLGLDAERRRTCQVRFNEKDLAGSKANLSGPI